eukprot:m.193975 g.193975  ORF g.193975 m.193975 type:complete len:69 (+) comp14887_c0_seq2:292-498(+)
MHACVCCVATVTVQGSRQVSLDFGGAGPINHLGEPMASKEASVLATKLSQFLSTTHSVPSALAWVSTA